MALQDHIHTFEDLGTRHPDGRPMAYRDFLAVAFSLMRGRPLPVLPPGPLPVREARINWGRWLVDCADCNSAMNVTTADTTVICLDCGAGWFQAPFPPPGVRIAIEQALLRRPGRMNVYPNSNWTPGESVADLIADNVRMGVT